MTTNDLWRLTHTGFTGFDGEWEAMRPTCLDGFLGDTGLRMTACSDGRRFTRWSARFLDGLGGGRCTSLADAKRRAEAWWESVRAAQFAAFARRWETLFFWDTALAAWVETALVANAWEHLSAALHRQDVRAGVYAVRRPDGRLSYYKADHWSLAGVARGPGGAPIDRCRTSRVCYPPVPPSSVRPVHAETP